MTLFTFTFWSDTNFTGVLRVNAIYLTIDQSQALNDSTISKKCDISGACKNSKSR